MLITRGSQMVNISNFLIFTEIYSSVRNKWDNRLISGEKYVSLLSNNKAR